MSSFLLTYHYRFDSEGYFIGYEKSSGFYRFVNPHTVTEIVGYEPYTDEQGNEALRPVMGERTVYDEESYVPDDLTDVKPPDSPGFYRAKWTGTEWVEGGEPPEPDLGTLKAKAVTQTKMWVAAELEKGMVWTDGKTYTVTLEKQNMLTSQLSMYVMNAQIGIDYPLKWNASGEECTYWSYENLFTLANGIAAYVMPVVAKQQTAETRIKQAETAGEIDKILEEFV